MARGEEAAAGGGRDAHVHVHVHVPRATSTRTSACRCRCRRVRVSTTQIRYDPIRFDSVRVGSAKRAALLADTVHRTSHDGAAAAAAARLDTLVCTSPVLCIAFGSEGKAPRESRQEACAAEAEYGADAFSRIARALPLRCLQSAPLSLNTRNEHVLHSASGAQGPERPFNQLARALTDPT